MLRDGEKVAGAIAIDVVVLHDRADDRVRGEAVERANPFHLRGVERAAGDVEPFAIDIDLEGGAVDGTEDGGERGLRRRRTERKEPAAAA